MHSCGFDTQRGQIKSLRRRRQEKATVIARVGSKREKEQREDEDKERESRKTKKQKFIQHKKAMCQSCCLSSLLLSRGRVFPDFHSLTSSHLHDHVHS